MVESERIVSMEQGCNRALEIFAIVGLDESAPPSTPHEKGLVLMSVSPQPLLSIVDSGPAWSATDYFYTCIWNRRAFSRVE